MKQTRTNQYHIPKPSEMLHEDLLVDPERVDFVRVDQFLLEVHVVVQDLDGKVLHQHLHVRDEVTGQDGFALLLRHPGGAYLTALDQEVHLLAVGVVEDARFQGSLWRWDNGLVNI